MLGISLNHALTLSLDACRHRCAMDRHPSHGDVGAAAALDNHRSAHHQPWCAKAARANAAHQAQAAMCCEVFQLEDLSFDQILSHGARCLHCRGAHAPEPGTGSQSGSDSVRLPPCDILVQVSHCCRILGMPQWWSRARVTSVCADQPLKEVAFPYSTEIVLYGEIYMAARGKF